jgi:hypothetical protein
MASRGRTKRQWIAGVIVAGATGTIDRGVNNGGFPAGAACHLSCRRWLPVISHRARARARSTARCQFTSQACYHEPGRMRSRSLPSSRPTRRTKACVGPPRARPPPRNRALPAADSLTSLPLPAPSAVAVSPEREKKFPIGPANAIKLGYDPAEIDALPASVTESFCGSATPWAWAKHLIK